MNTPIPPRLLEFVDERVFNFAQGAQRHFGTNDLVVLLDFREEVPGLEALPRQRLAEADELPLDLRLKLAKPVAELKPELGAPDQSFWYLVIFEDEDFECGEVNVAFLASDKKA